MTKEGKEERYSRKRICGCEKINLTRKGNRWILKTVAEGKGKGYLRFGKKYILKGQCHEKSFQTETVGV